MSIYKHLPIDEVITFVLAGGKGERLSPLTDVRPKPAVPVGGTLALIDFVLTNIVKSNFCKLEVPLTPPYKRLDAMLMLYNLH